MKKPLGWRDCKARRPRLRRNLRSLFSSPGVSRLGRRVHRCPFLSVSRLQAAAFRQLPARRPRPVNGASRKRMWDEGGSPLRPALAPRECSSFASVTRLSTFIHLETGGVSSLLQDLNALEKATPSHQRILGIYSPNFFELFRCENWSNRRRIQRARNIQGRQVAKSPLTAKKLSRTSPVPESRHSRQGEGNRHL
jgi:hypothetical protein